MIYGHPWKVAIVSKITKPHFRLISPFVYASCWVFIILNIFFLSPAFFLGGGKGLPLVGVIPSDIWGGIFILIGFSMAGALITNDWQGIKTFLYVGLGIKAAFAWSLLFIFLANPVNIGVMGLWFGLMAWQALCIIYFTPRINHGKLQRL